MQTKHTQFSKNTVGRDFFVGDLHGVFHPFMDALSDVNFDFTRDRVFSVGDLIDRGPDSDSTLELLRAPWFHAVIGNHEKMMLDAPSAYHKWNLWMMNGGVWASQHSDEDLESWRQLILDRMHTHMTIDTDHGLVGVVHAEPNEAEWSENWASEESIWGRSIIRGHVKRRVNGVAAVIVGHTPLKHIVNIENVFFIDTGNVFNKEAQLWTLDEILSSAEKLR